MALVNAVQLFGFPTLCVVLGRRGSGKSNLGRVAAKYWRAPKDAAQGVLLIDRLTVQLGGTHRADAVVAEPPPLEQIRGRYSLVIVDEADYWLPLTGKPNETLIDIIRRGRHFGVTCIIMTQRPSALSYDARALADKIFLFSLTSESDLKWVEGQDPGLKVHREWLRHARPGQALLWDATNYTNPVSVLPKIPLDK